MNARRFTAFTNERNSTQVTCAAGFSAALRPLWGQKRRTKASGGGVPCLLCLRKRTIRQTSQRVRFVPQAVVSRCSNMKPKLLDHPVGACQYCVGGCDTKCFCRPQVNR